jgi:hypothetical protein
VFPSGSDAVRVIALGVFLLTITDLEFAIGGELELDDIKISSSVIEAQAFTVLPFTVTLTYLALVDGMVYFSEFNVVPLLLVVNTLVNVVPSVDVAITKLFCLVFPLYHAMSTLQIL